MKTVATSVRPIGPGHLLAIALGLILVALMQGG